VAKTFGFFPLENAENNLESQMDMAFFKVLEAETSTWII
jgi:hypothetical protein